MNKMVNGRIDHLKLRTNQVLIQIGKVLWLCPKRPFSLEERLNVLMKCCLIPIPLIWKSSGAHADSPMRVRAKRIPKKIYNLSRAYKRAF